MIKVCGVSRERELESLARLEIDYAGLCVFPGRSYSLEPDRAAALARSAQGVAPVLVTLARDPAEIASLVEKVRPAAVQLGALLRQSQLQAIREKVGKGITLIQVLHVAGGKLLEGRPADGPDLYIVDHVVDGALGSTGVALPEAMLAQIRDFMSGRRFLLAGGLDASNAADAVRRSGAAGVDVCSAVRDVDAVDPARVAALADEVRAACG